MGKTFLVDNTSFPNVFGFLGQSNLVQGDHRCNGPLLAIQVSEFYRERVELCEKELKDSGYPCSEIGEFLITCPGDGSEQEYLDFWAEKRLPLCNGLAEEFFEKRDLGEYSEHEGEGLFVEIFAPPREDFLLCLP